MMIGPAPMISIDSMSVRLGIVALESARGGVILGKEIALDQLDQNVYHLDMKLLHAIGIAAARRAYNAVGGCRKRRSAAPGQHDRLHAYRCRGARRREHILAGAAGADRDQNVARA